MFPWQRRIVGGVIFYAIQVKSRKAGDYFFPEFLVFVNADIGQYLIQ
jgi:hypothetical protein